jgi:hypothetical protein
MKSKFTVRFGVRSGQRKVKFTNTDLGNVDFSAGVQAKFG